MFILGYMGLFYFIYSFFKELCDFEIEVESLQKNV